MGIVLNYLSRGNGVSYILDGNFAQKHSIDSVSREFKLAMSNFLPYFLQA